MGWGLEKSFSQDLFRRQSAGGDTDSRGNGQEWKAIAKWIPEVCCMTGRQTQCRQDADGFRTQCWCTCTPGPWPSHLAWAWASYCYWATAFNRNPNTNSKILQPGRHIHRVPFIYTVLPNSSCALNNVYLFGVVGGMLCKSDTPSIICHYY